MRKLFLVAALSCLAFSSGAIAQSPALWSSQQGKITFSEGMSHIASRGSMTVVNQSRLNALFADKTQPVVLDIPLPDGQTARFKLTPAPVMAKELAAKFPQLMSYKGTQISDPFNTGRFNISPFGLSGMFRYAGDWVFLSPQEGENSTIHTSYFKRDAIQTQLEETRNHRVLSIPSKFLSGVTRAKQALKTSGDEIRTFRLAVSTTAEYTAANDGVNGAMAELDRLVNRVNQILLTDLSIQFELIADNDQLIFSDASTDPFANDGSVEDLEANQQTIDTTIGSGNYDIGHLLSTSGGGLAFVGVTCLGSFKAQGYTGSSRPSGESFYIDLVIHELGHQLGARHTFNAIDVGACTGGDGGQRSTTSSVEPGSGSTIMAYAGICGSQNLQNNSDPYFHPFSINEIRTSIARFESCGITTNPDNAVPEAADLTSEFTIPANTPFKLTAEATDADDDSLTFGWDQIDPAGVSGATASRDEVNQDNGFNPLFRSFTPTTSPTRYFPMLSSVLNNTSTFGETLPTTERDLDFEVVVRDNLGGVDSKKVSVNVVDTGSAFSITQPTAGTTWTGTESQDIVWETAGTELSPISCSSVDILLDADGDDQFNTVLASEEPNDGQAQVTSPSSVTTEARLMIQCSNNVFYAVNPGAFSITSGTDPIAPVITGQNPVVVDEDGSRTISFSDLIVDDPDSDFPEGFTLTVGTGSNYNLEGTTVSPNENFNGQLSVDVSVNDGENDSNVFPLSVTVNPINDRPIANDDSITVNQGSGETAINVLSNDDDVDGDVLVISDLQYSGSGSLTVDGDQVNYTPAASFSGSESATYTIEDPDGESDSATITLRVTATITPPPPTNTDSGGGGSLIWLLLGLLVSLGSRQLSGREKEKHVQIN